MNLETIIQGGSFAVMACAFLFLILKQIPEQAVKIEKMQKEFFSNLAAVTADFTQALEDHDDNFKATLKEERDLFREQIDAARSQSNSLATAGHTAVNNLTTEVRELRSTVDKLNTTET